jgi:hypothetical protein
MTEPAYTIGRTSGYDRALVENSETLKIGRQPDYQGGWVWQTREEAEAFLSQGKIEISGVPQDHSTFSVYGLVLPTSWDTDVSKELDECGVHMLLNDAKVVGL